MTREELIAEIKRDIEQKGGASVPIGIVRRAVAEDASDPPTINAALRRFARGNGWYVREDDDLPTLRVFFYPAND